jgi:hypothetical protein
LQLCHISPKLLLLHQPLPQLLLLFTWRVLVCCLLQA